MRTRADVVKGRRRVVAGAVGLVLGVTFLVSMVAGSGASVAGDGANTQVTRLHQLQAAFHQALSAPAPGEDNDVAQRVQDVLVLFDDDAALTFVPNGTTYTGKGDCSPGSLTLCDFFTNVSPALQEGNHWVSLSPTYKTDFDIHGDTASIYFECLFFDHNLNPTIRVSADGTAKMVRGRWVFTEFNVAPVGIPHP
jgi:hypothetical protein